ncbi:ubiquitin-conjugating enzyme E2 32-like, partial [Prunus avium]|uniref:Ubiquitin-conjugating enzyme E2 32-like n=1 Tax=Prunus avium TaxID=42229 RepID=A0A6P5RLN2_PRUAV
SNPYECQFAIRGPNGTDFEGGIYHGRIQFSKEHPNKPPIFQLLTENGRFKTQTEICFEMSSSFQFVGVRDALLRLIDLLPTYPDGALGSIGYNKKKRRALAIKSRVAAPKYGTDERQKLIDEIHEYMLSKSPPLRSNRGGDIQASYQNDLDKRMPGINILVGNTIHANNSKRVGIFDFENKCSKKAKQVVSS